MKLDAVFAPSNEETTKPSYQSAGASGFDLHADMDAPFTLSPRETRIIGTGLRVALPSGLELQVRTRSGNAAKRGLVVLNSPGTIDADYRGEVGVILHNASCAPQEVQPDDRIAQAVIAPVIMAELNFTDKLDTTERGEGAFGSTGQ